MIFGKFFHQIRLYLLRILILRKPKPIRDPLYMSIYHNARIMIDIAPDHISSLSSYARQ